MVCAVGDICTNELENRHHMGGGLGPIMPEEHVALIVLGTDGAIGAGLEPNMISPKRLGRGEISLARVSHATLDDIRLFVVKEKTCIGAAAVEVSKLRSVAASWKESGRQMVSRGACVLPDVNEGDHDSHASLKTCAGYEHLGQTLLGTVKTAVCAELRKKFGTIRRVDEIFTAPAPSIPTTSETWCVQEQSAQPIDTARHCSIFDCLFAKLSWLRRR